MRYSKVKKKRKLLISLLFCILSLFFSFICISISYTKPNTQNFSTTSLNYDFSNSSAVENFKYNVLLNHDAKINKWNDTYEIFKSLHALSNSLRVDTNNLNWFKNVNPLLQNYVNFNIQCVPRSFVNPNSYLTIEKPNKDTRTDFLIRNQDINEINQKSSIQKFVKSFFQREECYTMHSWKNLIPSEWRTSSDNWGTWNGNDPAILVGAWPQNWAYVYENLIKISSLKSPFTEVDISFFEEPISSQWNNNNSIINCFNGFVSNDQILNQGNGKYYKLNNYNSLPENFKKLKCGSVMSASVWHNITTTWVTLLDFISFVTPLDIKAINFDLNNLFAIDNYGMEIEEDNSHAKYFVTIGFNEKYFEGAQVLYENQNLYLDYENGLSEQEKNEWMDLQYIKGQNNCEKYRDDAINHIKNFIIKPDDFIFINNKKNYDSSEDIISTKNINQIKQQVNLKAKEKKEVPSIAEIDKIINNNRSDEWAQACIQYNIQTAQVYDNLVIVLPYLRYSPWLLIGNNSENPTQFDKALINSDAEFKYLYFEQIIDGYKLYLSNDSVENNRSFKLNVNVEHKHQNPQIQTDDFITQKNIIEINDQLNFNEKKTIELKTLNNNDDEKYWYMHKDAINIVDYSKKDNYKNVDLQIKDNYKNLTPSEAFNQAEVNNTQFSTQDKLTKMFYNANNLNNAKNSICPIEAYDLYNNKINIQNKYLSISFNDQYGQIIITPIDYYNNEIHGKKIIISGFKSISEIFMDFNFDEIIVALDQPNIIKNSSYRISVCNPPKECVFQLKVVDKSIIDIVYEQSVIDEQLICDFKIKPLKIGHTKINVKLVAANFSQEYLNSETQNIYVDEVYTPEKMPIINNENWNEEKMLLPLNKNISNRIFQFNIKNNILGTIADFSFSNENLVNIIYLNQDHTKFKFEILTKEPSQFEMTIKLKYDDPNSQIEYSTSKYMIVIDYEENQSKTSTVYIVLIIVAIILSILLIWWVVNWIIQKNKN